MRKNSPRKWLHACLDLLPVILIPVFMIYSHRHDVTENLQVSYKYESNEVNTFDDLVVGNIYHFNITNDSLDSIFDMGDNDYLYLYFININNYDFVNYELTQDDSILETYQNNGIISVKFSITGTYYGTFDIFPTYNDDNDYLISLIIGQLHDNFTLQGDFIFEGGQVSRTYINPFSYTDYNVIENVDIENTDVMDSFMNHFNNTIDKHFNMGNVFNLTGVYQWFNTNIFNGNAPQVIYSVWNIALYELVMDLLFLLYGLFMWFIDMVEHLMEKPFKSIK